MAESLDGRSYRPEPTERPGSHRDDSRDPRLLRKRTLSPAEVPVSESLSQVSQPVQKRLRRGNSNLESSEKETPLQLDGECKRCLESDGDLQGERINRSQSRVSVSESESVDDSFLCNLKLEDSGTLCTRQFAGTARKQTFNAHVEKMHKSIRSGTIRIVGGKGQLNSPDPQTLSKSSADQGPSSQTYLFMAKSTTETSIPRSSGGGDDLIAKMLSLSSFSGQQDHPPTSTSLVQSTVESQQTVPRTPILPLSRNVSPRTLLPPISSHDPEIPKITESPTTSNNSLTPALPLKHLFINSSVVDLSLDEQISGFEELYTALPSHLTALKEKKRELEIKMKIAEMERDLREREEETQNLRKKMMELIGQLQGRESVVSDLQTPPLQSEAPIESNVSSLPPSEALGRESEDRKSETSMSIDSPVPAEAQRKHVEILPPPQDTSMHVDTPSSTETSKLKQESPGETETEKKDTPSSNKKLDSACTENNVLRDSSLSTNKSISAPSTIKPIPRPPKLYSKATRVPSHKDNKILGSGTSLFDHTSDDEPLQPTPRRVSVKTYNSIDVNEPCAILTNSFPSWSQYSVCLDKDGNVELLNNDRREPVPNGVVFGNRWTFSCAINGAWIGPGELVLLHDQSKSAGIVQMCVMKWPDYPKPKEGKMVEIRQISRQHQVPVNMTTITSLSSSGNGLSRRFATGDQKGRVTCWELAGQSVVESPVDVELGSNPITALAHIPKKQVLLSASLSQFNVTNMETLKTTEKPRNSERIINISPCQEDPNLAMFGLKDTVTPFGVVDLRMSAGDFARRLVFPDQCYPEVGWNYSGTWRPRNHDQFLAGGKGHIHLWDLRSQSRPAISWRKHGITSMRFVVNDKEILAMTSRKLIWAKLEGL